MHALILEQDSWIILMIEDVLRELGFTSFAHASSHQAAVAAAHSCCPDLITADLRLDTSSGIEAIREICTHARIPVVFVTATPWEVRALDATAVVVAKPFAGRALSEAVARVTGVLDG